jgi:glycosyltransferase involved in cell wall biosynthesis
MIARDEHACVAQCLESVRPVVDELIVIDTGSNDDTRDIARSYGARVADFSWCDDFAAARNAAIDLASHPWVLSMDADDTVDQANRARLAAIFDGLGEDNAGYLMQCASLGQHGTVISSVGHVRLFRNDPRIRWEHRIHEQIAAAIQRAGGCIVATDVVVHHHGYADPGQLRRPVGIIDALMEIV